MDHVIIDAGTLTFSDEDLTATGLLVPFGVPGRTNVGLFTFGPGDITIPQDTTGMSLNLDHRREDVVGGISRAWEQPEGVMGTFKYSDTPEGRAAYQEGKTGKRRHLSSEVSNVRIRDGKAVPGARLFAAAQVERPAFEGATLLAALDTPEPGAEWESPNRKTTNVSEFEDAEGVKWKRTEITQTTVERVDSDSTDTTDATQAEDTEEEGSTVTATATPEAPASVPTTQNAVPSTLLASDGTPAAAVTKAYELGTIYAAMNTLRVGGSADVEAAHTLLAALADIKVETAGGLTGTNSGVIAPAWVGQVWQGRSYVRRFLDLVVHNYGGISIGGRKGFKIDQGTALVDHWAGNKAAVPTGTASTSLISATRRQYGYAADIAREFFDLEGGEAVIGAFIQGVVDSYAKITDQDAVEDLIGAATGAVSDKGVITLDGSRINAPGTDYPTEYPFAAALLIDAIDSVVDADDEPGFALMNRAAWRQLRFTPKDALPEYVTLAVKGTGEADADGVIAKRAPEALFDAAGFDNTQPAVVAGARTAVEFREQGQTPIRLDALDIARGGVDKAVIGYMETFIVRPEALQAFGTAKAAG